MSYSYLTGSLVSLCQSMPELIFSLIFRAFCMPCTLQAVLRQCRAGLLQSAWNRGMVVESPRHKQLELGGSRADSSGSARRRQTPFFRPSACVRSLCAMMMSRWQGEGCGNSAELHARIPGIRDIISRTSSKSCSPLHGSCQETRQEARQETSQMDSKI